MKMHLALAVALLATPSLAWASWTKTYVVEWYEAADYYGAKSGTLDPGTDCPGGTNASPDWVKVMVDAGYTPEEAKWLRDPANPTRSPIHGQNQMAFRGKDRANVYVNPTSTPDTGLIPVTGTIGEGLDLDGNPATGFTSPTGERGIDNNLYRALGCWKPYRGPPRKSTDALASNDSMKEGAWTVLVVVSGKGKDPLNDNDVAVGLYASGDRIVKDGAGEVTHDYTFRIQPDARLEALFKGRTRGGRITTAATPVAVIHEPGSYRGGLELLKAKLSLQMTPEGGLTGYLGGYTPWRPIYDGWVKRRGPVIEALSWVKLPDVYYALRRNADYSPTGPKGEKTHISTALRLSAVPAFVMAPGGDKPVTAVVSYKAVAPPPRPPEDHFYSDHRHEVDGVTILATELPRTLTADELSPPRSTNAKQVAAADRDGS